MECFLTFIGLLVFITVLIVFSSRRQGRARRRDSLFVRAATQFHGACHPGGWFGQPSVRFRHGQFLALLDTDPTGGQDGAFVTQLHFRWPDTRFRCDLVSRRPIPLEQDTDLPPIPVDREEFDRQFIVRSNNAEQMRQFMSSGVQWQVQLLERIGETAPVAVVVGHGHLSIRKQLRFRAYQELEEFLRTALELFDQAQLTQSVGIEFVDEDEVQLVQEAVCQICGEEIVEDLVFCRRCKTPHHLECWQYNGACSTYGCREERFAVPAEAKRAQQEP